MEDPQVETLSKEDDPYAAGTAVCCDAAHAEAVGATYVDPGRMEAWREGGFLAAAAAGNGKRSARTHRSWRAHDEMSPAVEAVAELQEEVESDG